MAYPVQDLHAAFKALLEAASGSPALTVYDGEVPDDPAPAFALIYFYIETPDGLRAPDAVPLTMDSDVIDAWAYVHSVGSVDQSVTQLAAQSARAVAGRVRLAVLNKRLTVTGRDCQPIRHDSGQPPQRSEEIPGRAVIDQVDVYRWRSVPS